MKKENHVSDIRRLRLNLGAELSNSMLYIRTYSGCDTTSRVFNSSKPALFNLFNESEDIKRCAYSPDKMKSGLHPLNPDAVKYEKCPKNYTGEHAPQKATIINKYVLGDSPCPSPNTSNTPLESSQPTLKRIDLSREHQQPDISDLMAGLTISDLMAGLDLEEVTEVGEEIDNNLGNFVKKIYAEKPNETKIKRTFQ